MSLTQRQASSFESIDDALREAERVLASRIEAAESAVSSRIKALSTLGLYTRDLGQIEMLKAEVERARGRLVVVEHAGKEVDDCRDRAKRIADTADKVRSGIVKTVFNTSLNKVWRDLFVRLAPSEEFVPTFKLPTGDGGKVEAVLGTLHRSGKPSGSPGAMLSQGNLTRG